MDRVQNWLKEEAGKLGVSLSREQMEQFEVYGRLLAEWNERMNLTGITEREAVYEKHFYDSLTVCAAADLTGRKTLADIGSGAGFPAIPLKIAFSELNVTIVDALAKRIRFLEAVTGELGLDHVVCLHGRAEDVARMPEHRDRYDVATARAVARLAGLSELCLPFVRAGGRFVAMKGADVQAEIEESGYCFGKLNARLHSVMKQELPLERAERHLIAVDKIGPTPKPYPRKAGTPLKEPLLG